MIVYPFLVSKLCPFDYFSKPSCKLHNSVTRKKILFEIFGYYSSPRFTSGSRGFSYFPRRLYAESNEPSLYIRREKLSLQYVTKLAANPRNSAYDCVFNPKYERFYNNKPTAIKPLGLRIQPLLEEANINIKNIQHFSFPSKEPWTLNLPKIILDLHNNKKKQKSSRIF